MRTKDNGDLPTSDVLNEIEKRAEILIRDITTPAHMKKRRSKCARNEARSKYESFDGAREDSANESPNANLQNVTETVNERPAGPVLPVPMESTFGRLTRRNGRLTFQTFKDIAETEAWMIEMARDWRWILSPEERYGNCDYGNEETCIECLNHKSQQIDCVLTHADDEEKKVCSYVAYGDAHDGTLTSLCRLFNVEDIFISCEDFAQTYLIPYLDHEFANAKFQCDPSDNLRIKYLLKKGCTTNFDYVNQELNSENRPSSFADFRSRNNYFTFSPYDEYCVVRDVLLAEISNKGTCREEFLQVIGCRAHLEINKNRIGGKFFEANLYDDETYKFFECTVCLDLDLDLGLGLYRKA